MADASPSVAACMSDMAAEILELRARLVEVEDDRQWAYSEVKRLRARLAEVEAALLQGGQTAQIRCNAALQMIAGVKREHAAAWRDEVRPNLGPVAGDDR